MGAINRCLDLRDLARRMVSIHTVTRGLGPMRDSLCPGCFPPNSGGIPRNPLPEYFPFPGIPKELAETEKEKTGFRHDLDDKIGLLSR